MADVVARIKDAPDVLAETVERVLDRAVASAVHHPLDVRSPDDAYERIVESWAGGPANPVGLVAGWIGSKWATRTLHVGKRFNIPVRVLITAIPPLTLSLRRGTLELRVLASYVVHRLREAGGEPDQRLVQRITVNAYCWPYERGTHVHERRSAILRLAGIWTSRALATDEPGVRVRDAARAVAELDVRARSIGAAGTAGEAAEDPR